MGAALNLRSVNYPWRKVEQYLTLRFGEFDMAAALAERVFGRTGGQPLFVVSLVDYFVAQHEILEVDGHWCLAPGEPVSQDGLPRDLREMITRQIDRLTAEEQRLLEAASAAGAAFSAAMQGRWIATSWRWNRSAKAWRGKVYF